MYKSSDEGEHWAAVNNGLYATQDAFGGINAVAADPVHSGTVYAAYGNNEGVYKTIDGGAHWAPVGHEYEYDIYSLAIDPSHPRVMYAALAQGVDKSTDGGKHWSSAGLYNTIVKAIAVDPSDPDTVFAGGEGLWRSTDAGVSWTRLDTPGLGLFVASIAINQADPHVVYVSGELIVRRSHAEVIKSRDGGTTWEVLHAHLAPPATVGSILVDPVRPRTIYLATSTGERPAPRIERSSDGGRTWAAANVGLPSDVVLTLAARPSADGTFLVAGTDEGVFVSADRARRWTSVNQGLAASVVDSLSVDPGHPAAVYAGLAGAGLYKSVDNGRLWKRADRGIARGSTVEGVAVAPSNPQIVYAVAGDVVYASGDAGRTWEERAGPLDTQGEVRDLVVSSSSSSVLYIGSGAGTQVLKSTDGGQHWVPAIHGLASVVEWLAIDPARPWVLQAATRDGVYTTRSGGGTWTKATGAEAPGPVTALTIDPVNPATLYAGNVVAVYKSTDRGQTWSRYLLDGSGDVAVTAMAVDPADPNVVFFGTGEYEGEGGLERSTDGGVTWSPIDSVPAPITRLAIGSDATVHVGTSGHAVFSGPANAGLVLLEHPAAH